MKHEKLLELSPLQRLAIGVAQLAFVVDAKYIMVQNNHPAQFDRPAQPTYLVPDNVRYEFDDL